MELEFIVAGPFLGDCGLEPLSGMKGRTATARGGSGLSPGGKKGGFCWKVGLGGTEIRCWICWEDEPVGAGGTRGHAGGGGGGLLGRLGTGRRGTSLRRSKELVEPELADERGWLLVWAP